VILFVAAVLLKVDVLPASALFLFPIWQTNRKATQKIWLAGLVFLVCALSFWLLNRYGAALSKTGAPEEQWSNWSSRFFGGLSALLSEGNLIVISRACGILMLPAAIAASVLLIATKRNRSQVFFLLAASLPITLFWCLIEGNSARHNIIVGALAPLVAALPLSFPSRRVVNIWTFVLIFAFAIDYFAFSPTADTVVPSGRLAGSALLLRERCEKQKRFGKKLADIEEDKVFVLAPVHRMPLYHFEVITAPDMVFVKSGGPQLIMKKDGRKKTFVFPIENVAASAEKYLEQGYYIATDAD
jgi:hypothetical protein